MNQYPPQPGSTPPNDPNAQPQQWQQQPQPQPQQWQPQPQQQFQYQQPPAYGAPQPPASGGGSSAVIIIAVVLVVFVGGAIAVIVAVNSMVNSIGNTAHSAINLAGSARNGAAAEANRVRREAEKATELAEAMQEVAEQCEAIATVLSGAHDAVLQYHDAYQDMEAVLAGMEPTDEEREQHRAIIDLAHEKYVEALGETWDALRDVYLGVVWVADRNEKVIEHFKAALDQALATAQLDLQELQVMVVPSEFYDSLDDAPRVVASRQASDAARAAAEEAAGDLTRFFFDE